MVTFIYFIIIMLATLIGAIAGIGGGVIIKPVLDALNFHDLDTIRFLSTCAVFSMSIYSTGKHYLSKSQFDVKMVLIVAIGSVIGGFLGSHLFQYALEIYSANLVKGVQSILLAILLIFVLLNMLLHFKTYHVKNSFVIFAIGLFLGFTSSFLGIGGGPVNVAVFIIFFSCSMKQAVIYSLATIVFAQISSLFTIASSTGFSHYDLSLLLYVIPAALLGGIIGTKINQKINDKSIELVFNVTVIAILILNVVNAYQALY